MASFLDTPEIDVDAEDVGSNKIFAVLSYIGVLWLIGLLAAPNSRYAKFHANQGLVLFIMEIAAEIIVAILAAIFGALHVGIIGTLLGFVLNLAVLGCVILGIVNAAQGKAKELPLIGGIHILDKNI